MSTPLPATEVAKLYAALDAAVEYAERTSNHKLRHDVICARAFVKVYLLDEMPRHAVHIVATEAA